MTINQITSLDGTVVVTSPFGPVTDLSVPDVDTSTSTGYLSLTGAGKTATPGDLTQAGGLTINSPSSSGSGVSITDNSPSGIWLQSTNGGVTVLDTSKVGIQLTGDSSAYGSSTGISGTQITMTGLGGILVLDNPAAGSTTTNGISLVEHGSGGIQITNSVSGVTISASGEVFVNSGSVWLGQQSGTGQAIQLVTVAQTGTDGIIIGTDALHSKLNFFNSLLPVGQANVTGSRSSGAALASLLAALAAYGLILNNSTT